MTELALAFEDHVCRRPVLGDVEIADLERGLGNQVASGLPPDRVLYYLGQLKELQSDFAGAADLFERLSLRCPGENIDRYDFDAYVAFSANYRAATERAIERGVRHSVLVSAMPKSASALVAHSLSTLLGVYRVRLARGLWGKGALVRRWVTLAQKEPMCTHEHFSASERNIEILESVKVKGLAVHVRHPADALASLFNYLTKKNTQDLFYLYARELEIPYFHFLDHDARAQKQWLVQHVYPALVRWTEGWLDVAHHGSLPVLITRYEDLIEDMPGTLAKILAHMGYELDGRDREWAHPVALASFLEKFNREFRANASRTTFHRGGTGGFRRVFDDNHLDQMMRMDASPLFQALGYEPVR